MNEPKIAIGGCGRVNNVATRFRSGVHRPWTLVAYGTFSAGLRAFFGTHRQFFTYGSDPGGANAERSSAAR